MEPVCISADGHVSVVLPDGESRAIIPAATIVADLIQRLRPRAVEASTAWVPAPRIGAEFDGGINGGVCSAIDSGDEYRLTLGLELEPGNFASLHAQLEKLNGVSGKWRFPTLREQSILRGQLPQHFQPEWYLAADKAGHPGYAWCTDFGSGSQGVGRKSYTCRGRPVRSSEI